MFLKLKQNLEWYDMISVLKVLLEILFGSLLLDIKVKHVNK